MNKTTGRAGGFLAAGTLLGVAGMVGTYLISGPQRFFLNWVVWFLFLLTVGLGALFVVALEHLVGSTWSVPIRRVSERLSSLVLLCVPVGLIALLAIPSLYPWSGPEAARIPAVAGKAAWLNVPFFSARTVLCLGLWALSYWILVKGSLKQDRSRSPAFTVRARRFSALFMVIFAITVTIAAFDWVSSLEPEWYSDIFGVYLFAGTFLAGLASTTLGIAYLKSRGRLGGVGEDHLYNLGAYLFAFTVFWSYIAFAQYMLIWYANMPEEVVWYEQRTKGIWLALALAIIVVHFVVPFAALVSRESKRNLKRLRWVAFWVLCAHFLDVYWMVVPSAGKGALAGWQEASFALFFLGAGFLWLRRAMESGEDMPVGDSFLEDGLAFHL